MGHGNLLAGLRTGGVNYPLTFNLGFAGYSARVWQHVAMAFSSSTTTLTLYLNGVAVAQQVLGARPGGNALPLEIGREGPLTGKYWFGGVDDVRVWRIARSAADIQASYLARAQRAAAAARLAAALAARPRF